MGNTQDSFKNTLKLHRIKINEMAKHNMSIYKNVSSFNSIIIKDGVEFNTSDEIFKKERSFVADSKDGYYGVEHKISTQDPDKLTALLGEASREDLDLFITIANPELKCNPQIKDAFFERLDVIQKSEQSETPKDLSVKHQSEINEFANFINLYEGAQVNEEGTFFHKGCDMEKDKSDVQGFLKEWIGIKNSQDSAVATKELFALQKLKVQELVKHNMSVFKNESSFNGMIIKDGLEFNTSDELFIKERASVKSSSGDYNGIDHRLSTSDPEKISNLLQTANRDDLNVFITIANPELKCNPQIKDAFFERLGGIQKIESELASEDLSTKHQEEIEDYKDFINIYENFQVSEDGAYFHRDCDMQNDQADRAGFIEAWKQIKNGQESNSTDNISTQVQE